MTNSKSQSKVISLILAIALVMTMFVTFAPTNVLAVGTSDDFTYDLNKTNQTATLTGYTSISEDGVAEIPAAVTFEDVTYTVTTIGYRAFDYCNSLTSVTIPNSVTTIGDVAFLECDSLTSVTIPNSVTSIGGSAFSGCNSLTSVTIPNSVTTIGDGAFSSCYSLTAINVDEQNPNYSSQDGVLFNKDKTTLIQYPADKTATSYTIPNSVTSIGREAFDCCNSLTSVTIPNSVTTIGAYAFWYCNLLTSVTIPNSVTSIGDGAFSYCDSLTAINVDEQNPNYSSQDGVLFNKDKTTLIQYLKGKTATSYTIPSTVTSIGDGAFDGCDSLTSVTIPNSVTSIGDGAFDGCDSLTSVTIPNSVTSIGREAFFCCYSLTSVTIPNSVTSIGIYAFLGCFSLTAINVDEQNPNYSSQDGVLFNKDKTTLIQYLKGKTATSYTIPSTVTSIGHGAFSYCDSLTSVTIPNSVTSIGNSAFSDCDSLTDVYVGMTQASWETLVNGKDVFYNISTPPTVHFNPNATTPSNPEQDGTTPSNPSTSTDVGGELATPVTVDTVLTDEQKAQLDASGVDIANAEVDLTVETKTPTESEKTKIVENKGKKTVAIYLDINLNLNDGVTSTKITNTKSPVEIKIIVPANLRKANRSFTILRDHNGTVTTISPKSYNPVTGELIFATDRFSLYALAYEDSTTITTTPVIGGGLLMGTTSHIHNYTKASYNDDCHWYNCSCGTATSEQKHSFNAQGVCECGYSKTAKTPVTNPSTGARNNIIFVVALLSTLALFGTTNILSRKKHSR